MTDATDPDPMDVALSAQGSVPSEAGNAPDPMDIALAAQGKPDATESAPIGPAHAPAVGDLSKTPYAQKVAWAESHGNPNAKNPQSSALGLGQFMATAPAGQEPLFVTFLKQQHPDIVQGKTNDQILAMRTDPNLSTQAIDWYGNQNAAVLQKAGVPVTDGSKYGAHWFGPGNFIKLYNADPTAPVTSVLPAQTAKVNGLAGKTVGDALTAAATKMGEPYIQQNLTPGETLAEAGQNALPSIGHTAASVYDAVTHPIDTLGALGKLAVGLNSKIEGYAGRAQNPAQKAQDEAALDAMVKFYTDRYHDPQSVMNAIAHDPASVAMDMSALATGGEGALGGMSAALGKLGDIADTARLGTVGDALGATSSGVGTLAKGTGAVAKGLNPLDPGGVISGALNRMAPAAFKATGVSGAVTPEVDDLVKRVSGNTMSGADIDALDPAAKSGFVDAVSQKGVTAPAVREGVLKSLGLNTPTSVVTETAAPDMARAEVANAIAENNENLAKQATQIAGGSAPSPHGIGAALEDAYVDRMNGAIQQYQDLRASPGSFGQRMDGAALFGNVDAALSKSGIPSTPQTLALSAAAYPQANRAVSLLHDALTGGVTRLGGEIDAPELMEIRRQLSDMRSAATGSDIKAVGDITDAFHKTIEDEANAGKFIDPATQQPVADFGPKLQAANAAYRDVFDTFENNKGPNAPVASAVKSLKTGMGYDANDLRTGSGDADLQQSAQSALGRKLLDPAHGPATYNALTKALGTSEPVDDFIRQSLMANDGSELTAPRQTAQILSHPGSVAEKAFGPDIARAKLIHAAHKINNARPKGRAISHSLLSGALGTTASRAGAAVIGYHLGHGIPGALAAEGAEQLGEHIVGKMATKRAMSGARTKGSLSRTLGNAGRKAIGRETVLPAHYISHAESQGQPAYASGGHVRKATHEELVARLMKRVDEAKKHEDNATKPLLKVPDAAIVRALDVAQRAI